MKKEPIFLDTETTALNEGRLVQLAYSDAKLMHTFYCKPPVPIEVEAMATHHITEEMVEHTLAFRDNPDFTIIKDKIEGSIVVAHNALFDIGVLNREGIFPDTYIDTKRVAIHLFPSAPNYKLQVLRYWFKIKMESAAHSADGDVRVLEAVFEKLLEKMRETNDHDPIGEMLALTKTPVLMTTMPFGKYSGKLFSDIHREDRSYFSWLSKNAMEGKDEDFQHTIRFWMGK